MAKNDAWKVAITPLKYADAGSNHLIGLSSIDILLASPMGFDPYVGNQKFTTLLIELAIRRHKCKHFFFQCGGHILVIYA